LDESLWTRRIPAACNLGEGQLLPTDHTASSTWYTITNDMLLLCKQTVDQKLDALTF